MESATALDKKIAGYVGQLNTKQKKVVLSVAKAFAEDISNEDIWEDPEFLKEMEERTNDLETGKVKGYSWDEVKKITRQSLSEIKRK